MFYRNKWGITFMFVILMILSLITMLVLIFYSTGVLASNEYEIKVEQCRLLIDNVEGKSDYFGNSLDKPSQKFSQAFEKTCPKKDFEVTQKSVSNAAYLAEKCFRESNYGEDFLGSLVNGLSVCFYCGRVVSDSFVSNFDEMFLKEIRKDKYKSLFEEAEINNTNSIFLNKSEYIPDSVGNENDIGVFYYIYRPEVKCILDDDSQKAQVSNCADSFQTSFSKFVGGWGGIYQSGVYLATSSEVRPLGGVLLANIEVVDVLNPVSSEIKVGKQNLGFLCDVVFVPESSVD